MLVELRPKHTTHAIEFDLRPVRHDIPDVQAMSGHRSESGGRRAENPVANSRLAGLSGLIRVFGREIDQPLELNGTLVQIAEGSKRLFIGPIEMDFSWGSGLVTRQFSARLLRLCHCLIHFSGNKVLHVVVCSFLILVASFSGRYLPVFSPKQCRTFFLVWQPFASTPPGCAKTAPYNKYAITNIEIDIFNFILAGRYFNCLSCNVETYLNYT